MATSTGTIMMNDPAYIWGGDNPNKQYLGTSYILSNKADFEPGRTSDFIFKVKFTRDLFDMQGNFVAYADEATEALALSLRDYTGPQMSIDTLSIRTGNGTVNYAGVPSVGNSPISFTDYIGQKTEFILLAWYAMAHNILNDKIGFKEYYAQDGLLYKWAPNGTRQISWWLLGCWINEYNQGQFSRQNPDLRQFSTTILYDKPVPYDTPNYSSWVVSDTEQGQANGGAYTQFKKANYLGTQSKDTKTTQPNANSYTAATYYTQP